MSLGPGAYTFEAFHVHRNGDDSFLPSANATMHATLDATIAAPPSVPASGSPGNVLLAFVLASFGSLLTRGRTSATTSGS